MYSASDARAELQMRDCAIIGGSSALGATPIAIMPLAASSDQSSFKNILLRSAAAGLAIGSVSFGLCAAQRADPRSIPTLSTALTLGVGTWLVAGVLSGSRENADAFETNRWVWISSGAALALGGTAGYLLADDTTRRRWLTYAPLLGAAAGQLFVAGSYLRALPECFGGDDCDRRDRAYRLRRDALMGLGVAAILGSAAGLLGAKLTPTVDSEGATMAVFNGVF